MAKTYRKTVKITIRIPEELMNKVEEIVAKDSSYRNKTDLIREAISVYIRDYEHVGPYKIPWRLYAQVQELVERGYYRSAEDFIAEAVREHIENVLNKIERFNNFQFYRKLI